MALFLWARQCHSAFLFGLCGVVAGLGFYTFLSARVAILIVGILFVVYYFKLTITSTRRVVLFGGALALGFVVVALPIARNPVDSWKRAVNQAPFSERVSGKAETESAWTTALGIELSDQAARRVEQNVVHSLLAPLCYDAYRASSGHFVRGGLVDRVTSALAVLGLFYATCWAWRRRWMGIWLSYMVVLAVVGMVSAGEYPYITRMLLTVPFLAIMAAVGMEKVFILVKDAYGRGAARLLAFGLVTGALALNVHQVVFAFHDQPAKAGHPLMLSLFQESSEEAQVYYLLDQQYGDDLVFRNIVSLYGFEGRFTLVKGDAAMRAPVPLQRPCFLVIHGANGAKEAIIQTIHQDYPDARVNRLTHSFDGGIIVLEIGETGWESTAGRN